jgi:hypothetical protein
MPVEAARGLFILAVVVFLGWFALGTQLNIRKGRSVVRWLQGGLSQIGEKSTLRWLGSSAVELKIQQAREPLRRVEIFVVLEPRDVPFLWWFFRSRGRRDLLIVRSQLRSMPDFEFEALDRQAWSTRAIEREVREKRWARIASPLQSKLVAYAPGDFKGAPALLEMASLPHLHLVRLAIRRTWPNLEVQWRLADFRHLAAQRPFAALFEICGRL